MAIVVAQKLILQTIGTKYRMFNLSSFLSSFDDLAFQKILVNEVGQQFFSGSSSTPPPSIELK